MFDRLYDAINSMLDWLKDQFFALFDFLFSLVAAVIDWFVDLVQTLWEWQLDAVIDLYNWAKPYVADAWGWAWPRLQGYLIEFRDWVETQAATAGIDYTFDDAAEQLNTVADLYADAAWLLPLNEVMILVISTFTLSGLIRLGRWILSFAWWTG